MIQQAYLPGSVLLFSNSSFTEPEKFQEKVHVMVSHHLDKIVDYAFMGKKKQSFVEFRNPEIALHFIALHSNQFQMIGIDVHSSKYPYVFHGFLQSRRPQDVPAKVICIIFDQTMVPITADDVINLTQRFAQPIRVVVYPRESSVHSLVEFDCAETASRVISSMNHMQVPHISKRPLLVEIAAGMATVVIDKNSNSKRDLTVPNPYSIESDGQGTGSSSVSQPLVDSKAISQLVLRYQQVNSITATSTIGLLPYDASIHSVPHVSGCKNRKIMHSSTSGSGVSSSSLTLRVPPPPPTANVYNFPQQNQQQNFFGNEDFTSIQQQSSPPPYYLVNANKNDTVNQNILQEHHPLFGSTLSVSSSSTSMTVPPPYLPNYSSNNNNNVSNNSFSMPNPRQSFIYQPEHPSALISGFGCNSATTTTTKRSNNIMTNNNNNTFIYLSGGPPQGKNYDNYSPNNNFNNSCNQNHILTTTVVPSSVFPPPPPPRTTSNNDPNSNNTNHHNNNFHSVNSSKTFSSSSSFGSMPSRSTGQGTTSNARMQTGHSLLIHNNGGVNNNNSNNNNSSLINNNTNCSSSIPNSNNMVYQSNISSNMNNNNLSSFSTAQSIHVPHPPPFISDQSSWLIQPSVFNSGASPGFSLDAQTFEMNNPAYISSLHNFNHTTPPMHHQQQQQQQQFFQNHNPQQLQSSSSEKNSNASIGSSFQSAINVNTNNTKFSTNTHATGTINESSSKTAIISLPAYYNENNNHMNNNINKNVNNVYCSMSGGLSIYSEDSLSNNNEESP